MGGPSRLEPRTIQPSAWRTTATSSRPMGCDRKNTRNDVPGSWVGGGGSAV